MLGDTVDFGHSTDGSDETPRQRLIGALSASIEEVGYPATTVTDIVRRAKTSRRTFYDYFADREACLVALLTHINTQGIRSIRAAIDIEAPWEVQIAQAVRAWIENAAPQSAVMLSWIRETPGLGHAARQHKLEVTEAYIHLIQSFSDTPLHRAAGYEKVARSQAIMFIGGLRGTDRADSGTGRTDPRHDRRRHHRRAGIVQPTPGAGSRRPGTWPRAGVEYLELK